MKYLVGFKNGSTVYIEAHSVEALASNHITFFKTEKQQDSQTWVAASEVLFVVPAERGKLSHPAVVPVPKAS